MRSRAEVGDRIIAFAVMIQPLLIIMQNVIIGVFHMDAESTTVYRIILTAVPMVVAMVVSAMRNFPRFLATFIIAIFLLLSTVVFFPQNLPYVVGQGLRFFLPVVVPSFLCLTTVKDYDVVEKTLYKISWFSTALVLFYVFEFYSGTVSFEGYNMPFSYACLLPMVALYSHRKIYDTVVVAILLISVLAIGARGPAVYFLIYVIFDLFQYKSKGRFIVLVLIAVLIFSLPTMYSWLSSSNISSRTIRMLLEGNFMQDSGRNVIQAYFWSQLLEHPFTGIGLFGDRLKDGFAYCHNLFLEILLNFGMIIGSLLLVFGIISLLVLYKKSGSENRNRIFRYFCAMVLPLMTSGSYLMDSGFALFIGLCFLLRKKNVSQANVIAAR